MKVRVLMAKTRKKTIAMELIEKLDKVSKDYVMEPQTQWELPDDIHNSLVHNLRPYQKMALFYYHLSQEAEAFKHDNISHVLFHMATGSGKTDLMAALILYLYKYQGYQRFVFTVNSNSILKKTYDNLIDTTSTKYLFSDSIEIDGKRVKIEFVNRFHTHQHPNVIYIKMGNIQSLQSELKTVREGRMRLTEYENEKLVILGDEAHHYSRKTKLNTSEIKDENTWEEVIDSILGTNKNNKLLEFTATIDLDTDDGIYDKYTKKIAYQYSLDKFILGGYSKLIRRIESNNNDLENMINAVLVSEYRRLHALENHNVIIKPVIMFKSQQVDDSKQAHDTFNNMINSLSPTNLIQFVKSNRNLMDHDSSELLRWTYDYYINNENNLYTIISDIKENFGPNRLINVNDKDRGRTQMLDLGQYEILNSLESPDNTFRAVFAVAKLTEGWDVLNLYDIIRISDSVTNKTKSYTNSEAQLIGRGARYNPFKMDGKTSYKRRFEDESQDSIILETLHYHTINESSYIQTLLESFELYNIPTGPDRKPEPQEMTVKSAFKKTNAYKHGALYYNETVDIPNSYYESLDMYGIPKQDFTYPLRQLSRESNYKELASNSEIKQLEMKFEPLIVEKALNSLDFYRFNKMKEYLPNVTSRQDFLSLKWLDIWNKRIYVLVPRKQTSLNVMEKLEATKAYLFYIERQIKKGYQKKRGTNRFIGYPIKDYITDYKKRPRNFDTMIKIQENAQLRDMTDNKHFVYQKTIINDLELELVDKLHALANDLSKNYDEIYIIRMDENMHRGSDKGNELKLHQSDKNSSEYRLEGFQPDFIFWVGNSQYHYQIFIEPKGEQLFHQDKWKEDVLNYINENEGELIFVDETESVFIRGVKFYLKNDRQGSIDQIREIIK